MNCHPERSEGPHISVRYNDPRKEFFNRLPLLLRIPQEAS
jgi:hypothetical protein